HMWSEQPVPMEAPAALLPPPDTFEQIHLRQAAETIQAVSTPADAAPPDPAARESAVLAPSEPAVDEVVIATAESHPRWLKPYEQKIDQPTTVNDVQIPPRAAVPTTGEKTAVALTALWVGGSAIAAVTEPPADEEEQWPPPRREPDEDGEE